METKIFRQRGLSIFVWYNIASLVFMILLVAFRLPELFYAVMTWFSPMVAVFLFYIFFLASYAFTIEADGKITEKQWFFKKRELHVSEIASIKNSLFYGLIVLSPINRGPEFINEKHKKFPRYALPDTATECLRQIRPDLPIEQEYVKILTEFERPRAKNIVYFSMALGIIIASLGLWIALKDLHPWYAVLTIIAMIATAFFILKGDFLKTL